MDVMRTILRIGSKEVSVRALILTVHKELRLQNF